MCDTVFMFELHYLDATFIKSSVNYIWQEKGKLWVDMGWAFEANFNQLMSEQFSIYEIYDWLEDLEGFIKEELYHLENDATRDYAYILVNEEHIESAVIERGGNEENYFDELWDVGEWLEKLHTEIQAPYYPHVASLIADTLRGASAATVPVT